MVSALEEDHLKSADSSKVVPSFFYSKNIPDISLAEYLGRLQTYCGFSDECIVASLIYLDRVRKLYAEAIVNSHSLHRLLLASCVVACKFFEDDFCMNSHYACVGGIYLDEMNLLESQFLILLDFNLVIIDEEYDAYFKRFNN